MLSRVIWGELVAKGETINSLCSLCGILYLFVGYYISLWDTISRPVVVPHRV
jgi:hypothetical protein